MSDWVKWLLLGLLSIVFGIFVLGAPVVASIAVTVVTGVLLLISGALRRVSITASSRPPKMVMM